jgi:hypothetical protein
MDALFPEGFLGKGYRVFKNAHRHNCVGAQVGADDKRLVFIVTDNPDPGATPHAGDINLKFAPELRIADIVNKPDETIAVERGQAATPGTEM